MRTLRRFQLAASLLLACAGLPAAAATLGSSFTYQGSLKASGVAMNGTVNLEFRIYDEIASFAPLVAPVVMNNVPVSDGVFTVELDFGTVVQSSEDRWLEIVVNSTILSPRQKLTPAPLAQKALRVPLVFGGQVQESPYWSTLGNGAFAHPNGITEAVYNEARAQMVMPVACEAKNLFVRNLSTANYPNTTVTLMVNGVATLVACAQSGGATCSNAVNTVNLAAGDLVSLRFTPNLPTRPLTNSEDETRGFVTFSWMCE